MVGQLSSRLSQLAEQRRIDEDNRSRRAAAAAAGQAAGLSAPSLAASGLPDGGTGPDDAASLTTAGEVELRERLRLEALERRTRSLRAPSVVQTFRNAETRESDAGWPDPDARWPDPTTP